MDVMENLKLRHNEKVERILKEEKEERERFIAEKSRRGVLLSGHTAVGIARIKMQFAEKRILAFMESIIELIDLGVIKPDAIWEKRIEPQLESQLKALEVLLKYPDPLYRGSETIIAAELGNTLPGLQNSMRQRFRLIFFNEAARN